MKTGAPRGSTKVPDQTATDDTVRGTRSDDVIENTGGNNVVRTRGGDDHVTTGAGDDRIFGGRGDDTILSGLGDDTLFAGAGDDFVDAGDGDNLVFGGRGADTILAGSGDDTVIGGSRWWDRNGNLIDVGDGDNRVFAGFHNDTVVAGNGNDLLIGGAGNDLISAGDGDNQVYGGAGSDTIFSGAGDDTIFTGGGCWWQAGNDQVDAGDGDNFIIGGAGADTISAGVGDDTIFTGWGNDIIRTGGGADLVLAGGGHDAVEFDITQPRDGGAYLSGGWGRDTLRLSMAASDLTPALQAEIDDFQQHVQDHAWHRFSFESLNLTVRSFENIEINLLNAAPVAVDDDVSGDEDSILTGNVLTNDTDVDGDLLSVIAETVTTDNGVFEIQSDGSFTYSPDANFNGTERFDYTVRDVGGAESTATLTLTVNAVNDAPDTADDTGSGDEDFNIFGNVLLNDVDVDGDALTAVAGTIDTPNGTFFLAENGDYTFDPDDNFNGTETVSYTVRDTSGIESTATLTLTVNAVNDAPNAVDDVGAGDEDTSVFGNVLVNDTDIEGEALTAVAGTFDTPNGTFFLAENGDYTFAPDANFNGTETIAYTVQDASGAESTASLVLTVAAVNDAPIAVDDTGAGDEDTSVFGNVLVNDTDVEGEALTAVAGTFDTPNGTFFLAENGDYTFAPDANFNGVETVSYAVRDASGAESTASLVLTVAAVNDAPIAVDDTGAGDEDTVLTGNVRDNDTDIDGDQLTVVAGTFTTANGIFVMAEDGAYAFTPNENFHGTETVSYTVQDPDGLQSTGTLVLTVDAVNDAPTIDADIPPVLDMRATDTGLVAAGLGSPQSVTIESWVKLDGFDSNIAPIFASDGFNSRQVHFNLLDQGANVKIELAIAGDPVISRASAVVDASTILGQWNHFSAVVDGPAGETRILVNGEVIAIGNTNSSQTLDLDGARIGDWDLDARNLNGEMAGVHVWSSARTTDEVVADMIGTPDNSDPALLLDLDLANAVGNTIPNLGQGSDVVLNNGSVSGGPRFITSGEQTEVSGIEIADVDDDGGIQQVTVTAAQGTLDFGDLGNSVLVGGAENSLSVSIQGTVADINNTLATLNYRSFVGETGTELLQVDVSDPLLAGPPASVQVEVQVSPVITGLDDAGESLAGTAQDNIFFGGNLDDVIQATNGFVDTLIYDDDSGNDTVNGFDIAQDLIDLSGVSELTLFQDVLDNLSASGGDAVLDLGGGTSVTLANVSTAALQEENFLF